MLAWLLTSGLSFWQERDAVNQELIANLRQQIAVLQIDDDDEADEVPEADDEEDDTPGDEE